MAIPESFARELVREDSLENIEHRRKGDDSRRSAKPKVMGSSEEEDFLVGNRTPCHTHEGVRKGHNLHFWTLED